MVTKHGNLKKYALALRLKCSPLQPDGRALAAYRVGDLIYGTLLEGREGVYSLDFSEAGHVDYATAKNAVVAGGRVLDCSVKTWKVYISQEGV